MKPFIYAILLAVYFVLIITPVQAQDKKAQASVLTKKIRTLLSENKHAEALPYFAELEELKVPHPENFYFAYIEALYKSGKKDQAVQRGKAFLKQYGEKSKHYDRVASIVSGSSKGASSSSQQSQQTRRIGERYGGGIIFYVDSSGKHGLIAALVDQKGNKSLLQILEDSMKQLPASERELVQRELNENITRKYSDMYEYVEWYNGKYLTTGATADGIGTGAANTRKIIAAQGSGSYAAQVAANYRIQADGVTPCRGASGEVCYNDWYLPSKHELNLLYQQRSVVGAADNTGYWSSTEGDASNAWNQYFSHGKQDNLNKDRTGRVRAIRAF